MAGNTTEITNKPQTSAPGSGGMKAWLPLILTFVLMPVLAYLMTVYVLLPRMQKALGASVVEARETGGHGSGGQASGSSAGQGAGPSGSHSGGTGSKVKVPLTKIIVNVAGSLGSRLLLVSLTLVSSTPGFKEIVEQETDQLRDLAASVLCTKTISDLEKPEARNLIRVELLSQFNAVLGSGAVEEIYIPEFAIQ